MNALVVLVSSLACALSAPSGSGLYHGPQAVPHVLPSGHLADTHEVAAAKAAHLSALHGSGHGAGYGAGHGAGYGAGYAGQGAGYAGSYGHDGGYNAGAAHGDYRYNGPLAVPHVLHDGHIADTHEVAAAKAEHFAAVAQAQAHSGHGYAGDHDDGRYAGGYDANAAAYQGAYHGGAGYVGAYHGPLAKPVVLPSGYLADTHDVAALKGAHFSALAQASHHAGHGHSHDYHH